LPTAQDLEVGPGWKVDPDWQAVPARALEPVACRAAVVARHYPGSAAAADSGAQALESPAAEAVAEGGADGAADLGAQQAA
jgi:hypothetical protein